MREYFVYMLRFSDGSYYTGVTNSVEVRMWQYRNGIHPDSYVNKKGPFNLVRVECFEYIWEAIGREKQIKKWSRRKKDALTNGGFENLPRLSGNGYVRRIRHIRLFIKKSLKIVMVSPVEPRQF